MVVSSGLNVLRSLKQHVVACWWPSEVQKLEHGQALPPGRLLPVSARLEQSAPDAC